MRGLLQSIRDMSGLCGLKFCVGVVTCKVKYMDEGIIN